MATYNFTTSGSNWSLVVDGATKGPWPRHANGISSPLYKVDTTGTAIVLSVNAEPYYSTKIRSTDTVQINGVEKTGTLTEKEMAIESEAIAAESTGGATEVTVYQLKTVISNNQIKTLYTTPINVVPAQGVNKMIAPIHAIVAQKSVQGYSNHNMGVSESSGLMFRINGNYISGVVDLSSRWNENEYRTFAVSFSDTYAGGGAFAGYSLVSARNTNDIVNMPLEIVDEFATSFTGGGEGNILEVTVFYSIVDL